MSDDAYLHLLRCPINHEPLTRAPSELVRRVAESLERISSGPHRNPSGTARRMDGGLLRSDGRVFYPIVDGIPKLLVEEAIDLEKLNLIAPG